MDRHSKPDVRPTSPQRAPKTDPWGIDDGYVDAAEVWQTTSVASRAAVRAAMGVNDREAPPVSPVFVLRQPELATFCLPRQTAGTLLLEGGGQIAIENHLPADLPCGYHWLDSRDGLRRLIVVSPGSCVVPAGPRWGWAAQLYACRSRESWGIGDLADLRRLAKWSAQLGASLLLINPLFAVAPGLPQEASPYFPTSRRFFNSIYLRIEEVPGASQLGEALTELGAAGRELNTVRIIDRNRVYELKLRALEQIWRLAGRAQWTDRACVDFRRQQGPALQQFATFCALVELHGRDWRAWPRALQKPDSPEVQRAASDQADRVAFHQWLQWLFELQFSAAAAHVAIVQDMPIGVDPSGADAWMWQDILARGVAVGAPPDMYIPSGQNWGLPPWTPSKLQAAYYEPFIRTVRAALRHAGGLRIDHVMGLFRLFWIPDNASASAGAFVRYKASDLLGILALESQRAGAFIVGEDLGTVEDSARELLTAHGILSYRVLWFEEKTPDTYPEMALAAVTTHDLPTIAGMWTGSDLADLARLGIATNVAGVRAMRDRLAHMTVQQDDAPLDKVVEATHRLLAGARSRIVTATLDDALLVAERPNMPGTTDAWPNWSLALPKPLEDLEHEYVALAVAAQLAASRPCAKHSSTGKAASST